VEVGTFGLLLKLERKMVLLYIRCEADMYHRCENLSCIQMAWVLWLFECRI